MNTLSSLLQWIGTTIGANPNTLMTSNKTLVGAINEMTSMIYPVGSYFWTSKSPTEFNPNTVFGGTWERMNEGICLVSAGNTYTIKTGVAKDGGNASHTLTTNQMPSHTHTQNPHQHAPSSLSFMIGEAISGSHTQRTEVATSSSSNRWAVTATSNSASYLSSTAATAATTATNKNAGGGQAFSLMQPYKAAFCWHRIA